MSKKKSGDNELIGFKEFLEHDDVQKQGIYESKQFRGFDLITFLERESERLSCQISLFEEKAFILRKFPQDVKIISEQEEKNFTLQTKAVEKVMDKSSVFYQNLDMVLQDHFNYSVSSSAE